MNGIILAAAVRHVLQVCDVDACMVVFITVCRAHALSPCVDLVLCQVRPLVLFSFVVLILTKATAVSHMVSQSPAARLNIIIFPPANIQHNSSAAAQHALLGTKHRRSFMYK